MAAITTATASAAYDNASLGLRRRMSIRPSLLFFPTNTSLNMKLTRCSATTEEEEENAGVFFVTPLTKADFDYLGQSTKGDLNPNPNIGIDDGEACLNGPIEDVAKMEAQEAESLLNHLCIPVPFSARYSPRGIFCSRTLNLRSISAIGYDMDYTLMHYNVVAWEGRAYDYCMENLRNMGFPVDGLAFDPELVI
ncbi:hypothetical protein ACS0TY_027097 [Phlomoides rotata]